MPYQLERITVFTGSSPGRGEAYLAAARAVGTRLALRHGAGFVRAAFLIVVGALILKTGWDAWPP